MNKNTTILLLVLSIAFACTKETASPPPPPLPPDNIIHTDLNPNLEVCPIDSLVYIFPCWSLLPSPTYGNKQDEVDVNNDGVADFKIEYRNWYEHFSNSSPCANYHTRLTISSKSQSGGIINSINNQIGANSFKVDETISPIDNFVTEAHIYQEFPYSYYGSFGGHGFIGVKLSDGSVGWIEIKHDRAQYTCEVVGFAVNTTIGNLIKAGQTN